MARSRVQADGGAKVEASEADIDSYLDRLYTLPLGEFVAGRKRLADELQKRSKNAQRVRAIKGIAKPTLATWATNQTVRRAPDVVKRLLAATQVLAAVQRAGPVAAGPGTAEHQQRFQDALVEQRKLVAQLTELARVILGEVQPAPGGAVLDRVEKNLQWGPISEASRSSFERGRLERDVSAPGFDALTAGAEASLAPPTPARTSAPAPPADAEAEAETRRQARLGEQEAARATAREVAEARRSVEAHVVSLRAEVRRASARSESARKALDRSERERAAAARRAADAEKHLTAARSSLAAAEASTRAAAGALHDSQEHESDLRRRLLSAEAGQR